MRLGDLDALKTALTDAVTKEVVYSLNEGVAVAKLIDAAPTIEAEPVRHGRWNDEHGDLCCSVCKTRFSDEIVFMNRDYDYKSLKYCPECGAKMDGGAENAAD